MVAVMKLGAAFMTPLASTTGVPPQNGIIEIMDVPIAANAQFVFFVDGTGLHRASY
jgi:hypothetical protein